MTILMLSHYHFVVDLFSSCVVEEFIKANFYTCIYPLNEQKYSAAFGIIHFFKLPEVIQKR